MNLQELEKIARDVKKNKMKFGTAKELITFFGFQRRGVWNNQRIREKLDELEITTFPPFESTYIYEEFAYYSKERFKTLFENKSSKENTVDNKISPDALAKDSNVAALTDDPIFRVGKLKSANTKPTSVAPQDKLKRAITLMQLHDFSQLPVLIGRTVKGFISWKSITKNMYNGCDGEDVQDYIEMAQVVSPETSIFRVVELLNHNDAILIKNNKNEISGIITPYDLSIQFGELSKPFLLIAEIENLLRKMLSGIKIDELQKFKNESDTSRSIESINDLSFGEYIRILQDKGQWGSLGLKIDQASFIEYLDHARQIRNEVMHFSPDPLEQGDLVVLENLSNYLQQVIVD